MTADAAVRPTRSWQTAALLSFTAQIVATWVVALTFTPGLASLTPLLLVGAIPPALLLQGSLRVRLALILPFALALPAMLSAELLAHALGTCLQ